MLYWTMLAACTVSYCPLSIVHLSIVQVGPGTVVMCARAGAEYGFRLIWALIFASVLAFTLQEGTVRLTITSGLSLGQCLRQESSYTLIGRECCKILGSDWLRHVSRDTGMV